MFPSAALCRAQEAHHAERAARAQLDNVRVIATNAALAWGQEARSAERREARAVQTRQTATLAAIRKQEAGVAHDRLFSENPDRGFESP